jgi:hypothetical protein
VVVVVGVMVGEVVRRFAGWPSKGAVLPQCLGELWVWFELVVATLDGWVTTGIRRLGGDDLGH